MTALAQPRIDLGVANEAVVVGVEIAAGHDGVAEMVVQVWHENGVVAPTILDPETGFALLRAAGAAGASALIGRSWTELLNLTAFGEP
jgi:hypothetical protein